MLTRETKAGLIVAGSFVCLVGVVLFARLRSGDLDSSDQLVQKETPHKSEAEPAPPVPEPPGSGSGSELVRVHDPNSLQLAKASTVTAGNTPGAIAPPPPGPSWNPVQDAVQPPPENVPAPDHSRTVAETLPGARQPEPVPPPSLPPGQGLLSPASGTGESPAPPLPTMPAVQPPAPPSPMGLVPAAESGTGLPSAPAAPPIEPPSVPAPSLTPPGDPPAVPKMPSEPMPMSPPKVEPVPPSAPPVMPPDPPPAQPAREAPAKPAPLTPPTAVAESTLPDRTGAGGLAPAPPSAEASRLQSTVPENKPVPPRAIPPEASPLEQPRASGEPLPRTPARVAEENRGLSTLLPVKSSNQPASSPAGEVPPGFEPIRRETVQTWEEDIYTWQVGDSFAAVSRRFYEGSDLYAQVLLEYNRKHAMAPTGLRGNPPTVQPGQKIFIPPVFVLEKQYAAFLPRNPALPVASSTARPGDRTYRVEDNGELLFDIAKKTQTRWEDIYLLNKGHRPERPIPGGTVLRLPATAPGKPTQP